MGPWSPHTTPGRTPNPNPVIATYQLPVSTQSSKGEISHQADQIYTPLVQILQPADQLPPWLLQIKLPFKFEFYIPCLTFPILGAYNLINTGPLCPSLQLLLALKFLLFQLCIVISHQLFMTHNSYLCICSTKTFTSQSGLQMTQALIGLSLSDLNTTTLFLYPCPIVINTHPVHAGLTTLGTESILAGSIPNTMGTGKTTINHFAHQHRLKPAHRRSDFAPTQRRLAHRHSF